MSNVSPEQPSQKNPSSKVCTCGVCQRIELTRQGKNPYFVRELETGYVVDRKSVV